MDLPDIYEKSGRCCFEVRVQPRAGRNQIVGIYGGALKVRLTAPPLKNRANRLLLGFLAEQLELPARRLHLLRGEQSRNKAVAVEGISREELENRLFRLFSRDPNKPI